MRTLFLFFLTLLYISCAQKKGAIVFQSDFGTRDAAVNAMKAVAYSVDPSLGLFDLTHEIPPFQTWEAAYRLHQSAAYWPEGTVFVSVVDPGVGTERRSIVLKTATGHYFVSPDNGSLTLVMDNLGISEVRLIDEATNRRSASDSSYTFHGRDIFAYTAARLASGTISFKEVGPVYTDPLIRFDYQKPEWNGKTIKGNIPVLDPQYGNVWTNIHDSLFRKLEIPYGGLMFVRIWQDESLRFEDSVVYAKTFGDVPEGTHLGYMNSLMNFSLAINMGNFSDSFKVHSGREWRIELVKR